VTVTSTPSNFNTTQTLATLRVTNFIRALANFASRLFPFPFFDSLLALVVLSFLLRRLAVRKGMAFQAPFAVQV
jgi:hypothetical protein